MFLHIETQRYPLTAQQIIAENPNVLIPVPFELPDGYIKPGETDCENFDSHTHKAVELQPAKIGDTYFQAWEIVELTSDEIAANLELDKSARIHLINATYETNTAAISAGYPASERESWPVQTSEARALLYASPTAETPWIDAAALVRGLDRVELANKIVALDNAYRTIHGALSGRRQYLENLVLAAESQDDLREIPFS